ncbi:sugar phosphate isomerase/epimerase family protein [Homoserinibacter sp. YIM 151385]|uniref:sugar phosphate isomerase/epimerase family protein n=1 Tax=Homoserinibacter sp. YIM 151385 TaxID=2985506 RepID=UPI0022F0C8D9|nr:sugar phosphate isomerase/epimerase [Homoserinibacter sp. YIM 151385]WBU36935.1 sugar phosphate isomerase/epimerase [Homoserinibacter sp. YIM 151385]
MQLYTVRDALAADLPGTLSRLAEIGYRDVELFGFVDRVEELEQGLAAAGLRAPSGHAPLVDAEDPAPAFRAAARLGLETIIDPFIPAERWETREQVEQTAARLVELAPQAAEHGLRLGYHNHAWELSSRIDGTPALEVLADLLGDAVVLEVDTYWAAVGGVDAPELLLRLGERVTHLHIKDGDLSHDNEAQVAVGTGAMDVPAVLAAAPSAQPVAELDDTRGDVFQALIDSYDYLESGVRP